MSRYLIRVDGHLSVELSASLRGLDAVHQPAQTILVGDVADQAALTGVLDRLDVLGVRIHEVLLVPDGVEQTRRVVGVPTAVSGRQDTRRGPRERGVGRHRTPETGDTERREVASD